MVDEERIDKMIEVMQAYKNGAEIEVICINDPIDDWHKVETPSWDWNNCDYRIEKEKKYRPMTFEEIVDYWKEHRTEIFGVYDKDFGYYDSMLTFVNYYKESFHIGKSVFNSVEDFIENVTKEDGSRFEVLLEE